MSAPASGSSRLPPTLSAGVLVVRRGLGEWRFLMLRAYRNWDFPKGIVESGEEPLAAALREVAEETGLTDLELRWGTEYYETAPYGRNKVARYYLGETSSASVSLPVQPQLGRPEHHEWRWLRFAEALQLAPPRLQPILRRAAARLGAATARPESGARA
jgi:8-oxo-dGTP pyrophosphatase MutT (NUDIX family)